MQDGPIVRKTFEFAISVMKYCNFLEGKRKFVVANQLLKSGSSIGANVYEAQYAESRHDFIHKMKIASKEAGETYYWLSLCDKMDDFEMPQELLDKLKEIKAILSAIIVTSKRNLRQS